jgi:hypothetical protein
LDTILVVTWLKMVYSIELFAKVLFRCAVMNSSIRDMDFPFAALRAIVILLLIATNKTLCHPALHIWLANRAQTDTKAAGSQ